MRSDIYLYNDGGSWSVVASEAIPAIIADYREHDERFVFDHKAALFGLEGDDYSVIRVVVNEPLTDAEAAEWIARACWRLNVSSSQVVISGGFDPDCLADWLEAGDRQDSHAIDLPPGDYQITLYTYLHSMNGAVWVNRYDDTPLLPSLSEWFRHDHHTTPVPSWLAAMFAYEDVDPQDEWYPIRENVQAGRIAIAPQPLHWIGYLIHLVPFTATTVLDQPGADGWFDAQTGLRVPAQCPLGIATDCTEDNDIVNKVEWVMGRS